MSFIPVIQFENFGSASNLAAALNSEVIYDNIYGFNSIGFYLTIPTGATVVFECSFDGTNYIPCTLRGVESDNYTQKSNTSGNYIGSISSVRKFRVRVSIAGIADGSIIGRTSLQMSTLEGIEHGYRPDNIGNVVIHKDLEVIVAGTNNVWTPSTGKKFVVVDLIISSDALNTITVFDNTDISGNRLLKVRFPANSSPITVDFDVPFVSSTINNILKITTTTAAITNITVHGYEID